MASLTPGQTRVLNMIRAHIARRGHPPTRAEITETLGFSSPNAAQEYLQILAEKGAIKLASGTARGIRLTETGLPLVGRVAAGQPILADEHIEARYPVDAKLFAPRADYLLRVRGTSMRDAGILNGDLLAVHKASEARNGQIVVARLEDEVTVKRFHRRGQQVRLLAENPEFKPIEIDLRRQPLAIEGIGVGVIRLNT